MFDVDFAFRVVQLLLWIAVGLYTWQSSRHRATRDQVTALELKIVRLEERLEHLPTSHAITRLGESLAALTERIDAALHRLDRVEQYLQGRFG